MEAQKALEKNKKKSAIRDGADISKKEILIESVRAAAFTVFALLLGTKPMTFDAFPLAFALLSGAVREAPFVALGVFLSSFYGSSFAPEIALAVCLITALRILSGILLEKRNVRAHKGGFLGTVVSLFSEHPYLRMMSSALGVFFIGIWRIIEGGFRFYDLFASIFYLALTPVATLIFSKYFDINEQKIVQGYAFSITPRDEKLYDLSVLALLCSLSFSLKGFSLVGISIPLFFSLFATLYACKKGILYGIVTGLALGMALSPTYAPLLAFCAIAYSSIHKLTLFGAATASCISGLVWALYIGGVSSVFETFPALLCGSMTFCTAERINIFDDVNRFLKVEKEIPQDISLESVIAEQKANLQDERLRSISDSFGTLSEIFYDLSSKLKRPTMLDLRAICEQSFDMHCKDCADREICYGAEYGSTLEAMKKMTVALHTSGRADIKKLPESFKRRCNKTDKLSSEANRLCAIATKKAFQNEKTEIFALDYDAISKILNDAIVQNEEEFKIDGSMGRKLAKIIANEGYGEHAVSVFGKRKLKIIARGLDLSDKSSDVNSLKSKLEHASRVKLADPTFELAFGSVNMQTEALRTYSCEGAFATSASQGESVCGDTVSIFENKNDYFYALISDGMGTGKKAALTSEMCNSFLRNMLGAGNQMDASLRMLNSVLRAKGTGSENECSATVDLLQLDLYSGALSLIKSGAAPTFVIRRENVFKLASPSFPIGILRSIDAKQIDISCEDGDVIVMISDGATRAGDDCSYLTEMLREPSLAAETPKRIADKIIRRARAEADMQNDDISVVVVKIKKELCGW